MGKIIFVDGPGGAGKTTLASAIAAALARADRYTLLVNADKHVPALGLWMPESENAVSIGQFFSKTEIDATYTLEALGYNFVKKPRLLGVLGYKADESLEKYNPIEERAAYAFLNATKAISKINPEFDPDVVVDGSGHHDSLTKAARLTADIHVEIFEPDTRGTLSYGVRPKAERDAEKNLYIAFQRNTFDLVADIPNRLGLSWFAIIPFIDEAHRKLVDARLFEIYQNKQYRGAVDKIVQTTMEA